MEVLNIVYYSDKPKRIGHNQIAVPAAFAKVIYDVSKEYQKCFYFMNINIDKNAKLKDFQIECKKLNLN